MRHMHMLALGPLAFVMAVLCLLFLVSLRLLAAKAIRRLVRALGNAIDGEYAALAGGLQGKGARTILACPQTMNRRHAGASSSFPVWQIANARQVQDANDNGLFSDTGETVDRSQARLHLRIT